MRQHHIMRLGPLDREGGVFYEYVVFPGRQGKSAYYAADDESAIANILYDYEVSELVCEEGLAEAGGRFGIAAKPLSQIAALGLDLLAFERFPGAPFKSINEETLVHQFCTAAKQHFEVLSQGREFLYQPLRVRVSGAVEFVTDLYLHKLQGEGEFFSLMMEKAPAGLAPASVPVTLLQSCDRLWIARHQGPAFIADALRRAHGLDFIPVPWRTVKGKTAGVADMQLAVLISTLNAISCISERGDIGTSRYSIRQYWVDCAVCLADDY
jgi:hypothetical protein